MASAPCTSAGVIVFSTTGASDLTFKGSSVADTVALANTLTTADSIDGGAGRDAIGVTTGASLVKTIEYLKEEGAPKAIHIVTRGGEYKDMPYEMGDRYLRTILGFFGIEDIQTLAVDNTDSNPEGLEEILSQAIQQAQEIAVQF